jgi:predicted transposase/invertase (TIGR01784 family)
MGKFVRFDWAVKRLLRQKANFVVLEGFLSTLLGEAIRINRMLESEGNQESENDKFNRVDMLAENSSGDLIIIEVQNTRELDYFHRMLYGVSKAITEYIYLGEGFVKVKKVYSINIVYFDLGQGDDYVYHGYTEFRGLHTNGELKLSRHQQKQFKCEAVGKLYPEYYLLRVDDFDKNAVTPLEEWISFLKTGDIPESATAAGLCEARERLRFDRMNEADRRQYKVHMEALQYQRSVIQTGIIEGREEGRAKGRAEGRAEEKKAIAENALKSGLPPEAIANLTGLTEKEIADLQPRLSSGGKSS